MKKILSYEEAKRIVVSSFSKTGRELLPLHKGLGRIVASDIRSPVDSPPFARAAMDGFACHGRDVMHVSLSSHPILRLIGSSLAGETFGRKVARGQCVEVATGSAMPRGCDCVIMKEYVRREKEQIIIEEKGHPFLNVALQGEDIKKGNMLLREGRIISPQDLGILRSCGIREISVRKKPKIGIIITGSELVPDIAMLEYGKIIESNSIMMASLAERCGACVPFCRTVKDEKGAIERAMREGSRRSDLLLVTGGSSVGKKDLVAEIANPVFSGVAMRPGRPFGFAENPPTFVMSGYPVACFIQFYAFVVPAIEKMLMTKIHKSVPGILQEKVASEVGRRDFVRVRIEGDNVFPVALKGSGILSSLVLSDGFIVIEENKEGLDAGERVAAFLWV